MASLPPLGTEVEFAEMLTDLATCCAPSRFALSEELPERVDARVIAWGLDFGDEAVAFSGSAIFKATSAERTLRLVGLGRVVHLVWIDEPPTRDA